MEAVPLGFLVPLTSSRVSDTGRERTVLLRFVQRLEVKTELSRPHTPATQDTCMAPRSPVAWPLG